MQYKIITDEVRLVVSAVHDRTASYTPTISESELRARRIAAEAGRLLDFATERSRMTPETLRAKAFKSACFSVAVGAQHLVIPSKLVGVKAHQRTLWTLVQDGFRTWDRLELDTLTTEGIGVLYGGDLRLGEVKSKYVPWLRPLVPWSLRVYIARITGSEVDGHTLGVNIVIANVDSAISALGEALGATGDGARVSRPSGYGASGDGATPLSVFPAPALPRPTSGDSAGGDGASVRLAAKPATDPEDVILFRSVDGVPHATVEHVVRHSSGIEWGYGGSGPADLARSVLLSITDEATADRLYVRFKDEIVALVPFAGTVLRAAGVREWIARQS